MNANFACLAGMSVHPDREEAMRRGIGVYLPPESDLMRPLPVYGISEWDHNYIKLTSRARELSAVAQRAQGRRAIHRCYCQISQGFKSSAGKGQHLQIFNVT